MPVPDAANLLLDGTNGWLSVNFFAPYGLQIKFALNSPVVMVTLMLRSQRQLFMPGEVLAPVFLRRSRAIHADLAGAAGSAA